MYGECNAASRNSWRATLPLRGLTADGFEFVMRGSNVILDVVNEDPEWFKWSATQLENLAETRVLIINPIIYVVILQIDVNGVLTVPAGSG